MTELITISLLVLVVAPLILTAAYLRSNKLHPKDHSEHNLWIISERKSACDGKTILLNNTLEIHQP